MDFSCVLRCAPLHYISTQTMRHIQMYYTHPQWCQRGCLVSHCDFLFLWDWIGSDALQNIPPWMKSFDFLCWFTKRVQNGVHGTEIAYVIMSLVILGHRSFWSPGWGAGICCGQLSLHCLCTSGVVLKTRLLCGGPDSPLVWWASFTPWLHLVRGAQDSPLVWWTRLTSCVVGKLHTLAASSLLLENMNRTIQFDILGTL